MNLSTKKTAIVSLLILALLFAALLAFGMFGAVKQASTITAERTQVAAQSAINGRLRMIQQFAEDNAFWDQATKAVYGTPPDEGFMFDSWGAVTRSSPAYETVMILDHAKNTQFAFENDQRVHFDAIKRYGPELSILLDQLSHTRQYGSTIVKADGGPVFIGAAIVRPTSKRLNYLIPSTGPSHIIFAKRLTPALLAEIEDLVVVTDLRADATPGKRPAIPLLGSSGKKIIYLSWETTGLGSQALQRMLPQFIPAAALYLLILVLAGLHAVRVLRWLTEQAYTDGLSGLPNRRALRQLLETRKPNEEAALAMIDLDGFKAVNDNYGHDVGDQLIVHAAKALQVCAGPDVQIARLGGDEFAILSVCKNASNKIEAIAGKVLQRFGEPFFVSDRVLTVGASIGLAATVAEDQDGGELMRQADVAMYSAKTSGKMQICWFDPGIDQTRAANHEMALALRTALANDELSVVYQPQFDIRSGKTAGVEALLRWRHPILGEVGPEDFIPIAEETGLIDGIGQFVLHKACSDIKGENCQLAVNVSSAQLRNPSFVSNLAAILAETGFPVNRLEIEITENYVLAETKPARQILAGLRSMGVTIALDDFGSGYASIGFLRQFPFSKLKIDRTLVHEATSDHAARMLVQASVATARAMNMTVTAEGVEDETQALLMQNAGCDQLQGWHFGRPMSLAAIRRHVFKNGLAKSMAA